MQRLRAFGAGLTALSVVAYVAGIWVIYPGRSFAITAFMVGVTLVAIGGQHE